MWKYIFSIATLVLAFQVKCQQEQPPADLEKKSADWNPHEFKIGFNAIRTGNSLVGSGLSTHEMEAALALHNYIIVGDFGVEEHQRGETYEYENTGSYFRLGIDRNFTKDKSSGTVIALGMRYARATFEDRLVYTSDQGFGEEVYTLTNDNITARWIEITFGLRGKLFANLYTGFNLRWQFLRKVNGEGELKAYDIPGFGNTKRQNSTAFDYYIMWRIPFNN